MKSASVPPAAEALKRSPSIRPKSAGMTSVPWLRSLRLQMQARNLTRALAVSTEDRPPIQSALQTAVCQHLHEIGYKPPQQIGMK